MAPRENPERGRFIAIPEGEIVDDAEDDDFRSDEEKAFQEFRNSLGAGENLATIHVSRIPKDATGHPTNARSAWCFSCPIDRYDFAGLREFIRDRYGGGLYRLIGTKPGKKGTAFNRLVDIAEEAKTVGETPKQSTGAVMDSVGKIIAESQARTEALISRLTPHTTQTVDPFAMMERVITMLATMGIVGNRGATPAGDTFIGELEKLTKVKALLSDFGGGDDGEPRKSSNIYDLLGKTVDNFGPMVMQAIGKASQQRPRQARLPAPGQKPERPISPQPTEQSPMTPSLPETPMSAWKGQIIMVLNNAKRGVTPDAMAATIVDYTPAEQLGALRAFLAANHCVEQMIGVVPEVAQYREWFVALRTHALVELQALEEPATVPIAAP